MTDYLWLGLVLYGAYLAGLVYLIRSESIAVRDDWP